MSLRLIVALGNPGLPYSATRHNVGWRLADLAAERWGGAWKKEGKAETCELRLPDEGGPGKKALLVKPQTYMNLSGEAVRPLVQYYRLEATDVLLLQDDIDMPLGRLRLRAGGGHGGQNGVRDVVRLVGPEVHRLKMGVSRPPPPQSAADWVLGKFTPAEEAVLQRLLPAAAEGLRLWRNEGILAAQAAVHGLDFAPPSKPEAGP